jgi:hypothetical protein
MGNENIIEILVKYGVAGREDIEAAIALQKEAGKTAADLSKEMGVVSVSQADVDKALGKGGEKAELTGRAFKRLAHSLGSEIPGASALMEAGFEGATEPMLGATFLLMAGIEMLRSAIEKINKESEASKRIGEELADLDSTRSKSTEKVRDALEEAEVAEEVFHHNFIRNTEDAIAKASALAQAILKASIAASEGNDSTRKGVAEKEIEEMEQRGVISHDTALKMKEQLDIQYEQQKLQRMIAQDAVEREIMVTQLNNKQLAIGQDKQAEAAAESKYKAADAAKVKNDAAIDEAQAKIEGAKGVMKDLRSTGVTDDTVQQLNDFVSKYGGDESASLADKFHFAAMKNLEIGPGAGEAKRLVDLFGSQGDSNLALYQGAQIDIKSAQYDLTHGRAAKPDVDINANNAKSDLDAARSKMEKDRDDVRALQDKITESDATNAIKEGGAKQDLGVKKASDELTADRGIADQVKAGGSVSTADQQRLMADASRIAGHTVDLKTAAQIIENGANNMGIFMNQIDRLATALGKFTPAEQEALSQRIKQLEMWAANSRPLS